MRNEEIAEVLERIADLLEAQGASVYRVRAYRAAAQTARTASVHLEQVEREQGTSALEGLPGIGRSIAALVAEYLHTGHSTFLDRLEGEISPEDLFTTVPGIGHRLAQSIHERLGIETLEELELAAHDGRLAALPGFGERRVRGMRDSVAGILGRSAGRRSRRLRWLETRAGRRTASAPRSRSLPAVATLLAVDAEYRRLAEAGELRTITPRRFNPEKRAWLPVFHAEREGWSFTALYSNTARAHELGATHDWVVLYFERDGSEDQCTVVTERRGPLRGRRVVRGREEECAAGYRAGAASSESGRPHPRAEVPPV